MCSLDRVDYKIIKNGSKVQCSCILNFKPNVVSKQNLNTMRPIGPETTMPIRPESRTPMRPHTLVCVGQKRPIRTLTVNLRRLISFKF